MRSRELNPPLRVRATAKLNLSLEVLRRRADGFHELRTVLTAIRLADVVDFSPRQPTGDSAAPIEIAAVTGPTAPGTPADETNLVVRALRALREESGTHCGAMVRLHKRIPHQAGLGGGSSDAAAALLAANRCWSLGWSDERLSRLAAKIGSDLPFFVSALSTQMGTRRHGFAACCTGRGELVRPIPSIGGAPCVIVKPEFGLSTKDVYKSKARAGYDRADGAGELSARVEASLDRGDWRGVARVLSNGLRAAAAAIEPRLEEVAAAFARLPVLAHQMSGSGSAYYGLCESWSQARRIATTLRGRGLGDVIVTATC